MILSVGVVPPRHALDAVLAMMAAVEPPAVAPTVEVAPPRTFRWGRAGRERPQVEPPTPAAQEFVALPPECVHLLVSRIGSTTPVDAVRLTKAVGLAAAGWVCPSVCFAGGEIREVKAERWVAAGLRGDLAALETIAGEVNRAAQSLGFLLDRRSFRPLLSVASVPGTATGPHLEAVVSALEAFEGDPWTVDHLSLLQDSFEVSAGPREIAQFPLLPAGPHSDEG